MILNSNNIQTQCKMQGNHAYWAVVKAMMFIIIGYVIVELILPTKGIYGAPIRRIILNSLFYMCILYSSYCVYRKYLFRRNKVNITKSSIRCLSKKKLMFMVRISSMFGILGALMLAFDLIVWKKIDYSHGLRYARYLWLYSSSPHMLSSIVSMLGNGLVIMSFTSLFLIILHWEDIKKVTRFFALVVSIISIIIFAIIHASRSTVLVLVVFLFCALIVRKMTGKSLFIKSKRRKGKKTIILLIIVCLFMGYLITNSSKNLDPNATAREFWLAGNEMLYGVEREGYSKNIDTILTEDNIVYTAFYMMDYIVHPQWVLEGYIVNKERIGSPLWYNVQFSLWQNGVMKEPDKYIAYGVFVSLIGAIYYDYGVLGVGICGILLGLLLGIVTLRVVKSRNTGGFEMALIILVLSTLFLALLANAIDLVYLRLALIDMILFEVFIRIFYKKTSWLRVEDEEKNA